MKLLLLSITGCNIKTQLGGLPNVVGFASYSTATRTASRNHPITNLFRGSMANLYRRISPVRDQTVSIIPLLDQWVEKGEPVDKSQLQIFIRELRSRKRFAHALEMLTWMTNKGDFELTSGDITNRLELIAKVKGIEQAESYFSNIPENLRVLEVYQTVLNCYASAKSVEKAEVIMQQMRDLGFAKKAKAYNSMLKFYYRTGNFEKLDSLMHEMKEKGIVCNEYTYSILLSAYAAASDSEGIDKTLTMMESNPIVVLGWAVYATAANGYVKTGLLDKALAMLQKSECLLKSIKYRKAYNFLITQYAACGNKDDVLRVWELYKKNCKVDNMGYICVIPSVLKFDDLESAENIFKEWESQNFKYDYRIPNFLISAYCRRGLLQKAETLINQAKLKGKISHVKTWHYMVIGYLGNNQTEKAVEAMEEALAIYQTPSKWKPSVESLAGCLDYFKDGEDMERAGKFIELLVDKDIITPDLQDILLKNVQYEKSNLDALRDFFGDSLVEFEALAAEPEDDSRDLIEEEKTGRNMNVGNLLAFSEANSRLEAK